MTDSHLRRGRAGRGTLGNLASLTLPEIMQSLALGRKTARVTLTSQGRWGHIWVEDGTVRHAQTQQLSGELAFYGMVGWRSGEFLIEPDVRTATRSLDHDPMYLVMEGSRRVDESADASNAANAGPGHEMLQTIPLSAPAAPPRRGTRARAGGAGGSGRDSIRPRVGPDRRRMWLLAGTIVPLFAIGIWLPSRGRVAAPSDRADKTARAHAAPRAIEAALDEPMPDHDVATDLAEPGDAPAPAPALPDEPAPSLEPASLPLDRSPVSLAPGVVIGLDEAFPEAEESESAFLRVVGKISVKSGTLTLRVDGTEVYVRELTAQTGKTKRFFKRMLGKAGETFETTLPVSPGRHEIVAHVVVDGDGTGFDSRAVLEIDSGATRELRLVAGRKLGHPIALSVE